MWCNGPLTRGPTDQTVSVFLKFFLTFTFKHPREQRGSYKTSSRIHQTVVSFASSCQPFATLNLLIPLPAPPMNILKHFLDLVSFSHLYFLNISAVSFKMAELHPESCALCPLGVDDARHILILRK